MSDILANAIFVVGGISVIVAAPTLYQIGYRMGNWLMGAWKP
jgi:hypothetical protein